ncbi:MAG: GNAT family N-acetyltransferase [Bacteroidia bacterium]
MRTAETEIVRAGADDLARLADISRKTFSETFAGSNSPEDMNSYLENNLGISRLSEELSNSASAFYFARSGKEDIGYFKINFEAAQTVQHQHNSLELERIYVLNAFKNKGAGRLMLQSAVEIAKQHQLNYIWLGVWEHNPTAIRFYERNGFSIYGKHIFKLGSDDQTDHLMKLEL